MLPEAPPLLLLSQPIGQQRPAHLLCENSALLISIKEQLVVLHRSFRQIQIVCTPLRLASRLFVYLVFVDRPQTRLSSDQIPIHPYFPNKKSASVYFPHLHDYCYYQTYLAVSVSEPVGQSLGEVLSCYFALYSMGPY